MKKTQTTNTNITKQTAQFFKELARHFPNKPFKRGSQYYENAFDSVFDNKAVIQIIKNEYDRRKSKYNLILNEVEKLKEKKKTQKEKDQLQSLLADLEKQKKFVCELKFQTISKTFVARQRFKEMNQKEINVEEYL